MLISPFERLLIRRYLLPGRSEAFIAVVAGISLGAVTLGVAALVIVMSVMNGFRAELFDKIVGLNGHAVVQGYGGQLDNWRAVLAEVKAVPGVTRASPLIEQPLLASVGGRVEAIFARGQTAEDIARYRPKLKSGSLAELQPGSGNVALGSELAANLGAQVGSTITIINPAGRSTPFGTVPRQIAYHVSAIFEIGVYDFDQRFVVMPMQDAQTLLLAGDSVGMIEVTTDDPDHAAEMLAPIGQKLAGQAQITDWKAMNSSLFDALKVERVAMFVVLSLIVLVAVFNILSSLIMLVRAKTRDIAILRTMGASRRSMMVVFVAIGSSIGVVGTALGLALGALFLVFRQPIVHLVELLTGQNLWDPKVRFLTELPARADPLEITLIVVLALGMSFVFTLYPARKAASTDPVQVLRYE